MQVHTKWFDRISSGQFLLNLFLTLLLQTEQSDTNNFSAPKSPNIFKAIFNFKSGFYFLSLFYKVLGKIFKTRLKITNL